MERYRARPVTLGHINHKGKFSAYHKYHKQGYVFNDTWIKHILENYDGILTLK